MTRALPRGVFTLSLDFELVWGSRDLHADPSALVEEAHITREVLFEPMLAMLENRGLRATWATVGHLFLDSAERIDGTLHPDVVPPQHAWQTNGWFDDVPAGSEATHPAWYGRSLVERLRASNQEVGSHSFSHPIFGDPGCSRETAASELARCTALARGLGITLESFVFPRNVAGHVDLLAEHGFRCWRPVEPAWFNHPSVPKSVSRLSHLAEVALGKAPPTVLPVRDRHGLWQIAGSGTFLPGNGIRKAVPMRQRTLRAIAGINNAIDTHRISHLYVHPINFACNTDRMLAAFEAVLDHVAQQRDRGVLEVLSMSDLAARGDAGTLFAKP